MKPNGIIMYNGPSQIDGKPIVAILTGVGRKSKNGKTGDMCQLFIMRSDMSPLSASCEYEDKSICGNCPHKHNTGGACYVNLAKGLGNVYRAYKRGSYVKYNPDMDNLIASKPIRLGAYGEPTAIPVQILARLNDLSKTTGYTHRWYIKNCQDYRKYCVASVDSSAEYYLAKSMGWQTFRVRLANGELNPNEMVCPAESNGTNCVNCMRCNGKGKRDMVITVHGMLKKRFTGDK
jgi:hypothetical protein